MLLIRSEWMLNYANGATSPITNITLCPFGRTISLGEFG